MLFVFTAHARPLPLEVSLPDLPAGDCAQAPVFPARADMEIRLHRYLRLAEEALTMRAQAIQLYRELESKLKTTPLSGQDLQRVNEGAVALLQQRAEFFKTALTYECWASTPPDARREEGDIQRAGVLISLSAALILYDNYLSAVSLYHDNAELRRLINKPDKGVGLSPDELKKAEMLFHAPEIRRRVRQAILWYRQYGEAESGFEAYAYLAQSIEQSPSFHLVRAKRPLLDALGKVIQFTENYTLDTFADLGSQSSHFTSLLFGNTVGLVETRRGKLYARPEIERRLRETLRAGDILLEKTPFRLTDVFIPGHWGHAAIWVGSEEELNALGIWRHPVVLPYQEEIRAGRGVVEALRSGVEMNTLAHFMNIDDFAALRRAEMTDETRAAVILQTLRQVGKSYDFNFNAETTDRIFCSKLVYLAYGDMDWPVSKMLGRYTISPDDVARRALSGGPLSIVALYHDGAPVDAPLSAMEIFLRENRESPPESAPSAQR
ncbi:MAG: hypothetical protein LBG69_02480 [Zoogloeaceae bacterium]|nr:hypothetical protein [Zoogloeaceae bacterium]